MTKLTHTWTWLSQNEGTETFDDGGITNQNHFTERLKGQFK